jgi:hypothetical protein
LTIGSWSCALWKVNFYLAFLLFLSWCAPGKRCQLVTRLPHPNTHFVVVHHNGDRTGLRRILKTRRTLRWKTTPSQVSKATTMTNLQMDAGTQMRRQRSSPTTRANNSETSGQLTSGATIARDSLALRWNRRHVDWTAWNVFTARTTTGGL